MEKKTDVAIIGCGLCGISLASQLKNINPIILDKSKGIGGRIATRRLGKSFVNHGAEEFEVLHPMLLDLVNQGVKETLIDLKNNIAYPNGNLNQWVKSLSKDFEIQREFEVSRLELSNEGIKIHHKNNSQIIFAKKTILCIPAPQARQILSASGFEATFLDSVKYKAQVQFFLLTKSNIPESLLSSEDFYLKKMHQFESDEFLYHFEIHENEVTHFIELTKEEISSFFLNHFQKIESMILEHHSHKWRYSRTIQTCNPSLQFQLADKGIYLAGDYFFGDDLNCAVKSVEELMKRFHQEES